MRYLSEVVGFQGAYETLRELEALPDSDLARDDVAATMERHGVESPRDAIEELVAADVLRLYGDDLCLTTRGIKTSLLLEALNGGDLRDVYRRLGHLDAGLRAYELVREGMTLTFMRSLVERPGIGRLYFCSPWISLDARQEALLTQAVRNTEARRGQGPEVLVITRPAKGTSSCAPDGAQAFSRIGAKLFLHRRLHTKLYIREPDASGGYQMAILGSQNLTKSRHLELGIRVNADGQMIAQMIGYFFELTNHCVEA